MADIESLFVHLSEKETASIYALQSIFYATLVPTPKSTECANDDTPEIIEYWRKRLREAFK